MKQAKDFTTRGRSEVRPSRGSVAAKTFFATVGEGKKLSHKITPTATSTPLKGIMAGSATSKEYPQKFNRGKFHPSGTTNMDYAGRKSPSIKLRGK